MRRIVCAGCLGVLGVSLLILGGLVAGFFDEFINHFIYKELVIRNGSDVYETWRMPPVVPHLRIYFFNITNKYEFLNGEKPILQEVGPYCYREHWEKIGVQFHDDNDTVSYETQKHYYFEPDHSAGSEDDLIVTINIPLIAAVSQVRDKPNLAKMAIDSLLTVLKEEAVVEHTVEELMWGYDDPLLKIAKNLLPPDQRLPFDKFGFFINKNGSTDGKFNVFTGAGDMSKYTTIDTFNYKKELPYWKTKECNKIKGTDGSSFPPGITKDTVLYMFNENLCRSIPLTFWHETENFGVKGMRFSPPKDVFAATAENDCYCVGSSCIGGGLFNISICKFGSPTMISWPHFYQGDQKFLDAVIGLKPEPEKHTLYIDVSPRTGSPLSAEARLQINVAIPHVNLIKAVANLRELIFPVLWFEDGVTELPTDIQELLQMAENIPLVTKSSMLGAFFIIGSILVIGVGVSLLAEHYDLPIVFCNPNYTPGKEPKSPVSAISAISRPNSSPRRDLSGHTNRALTDDSGKEAT